MQDPPADNITGQKRVAHTVSHSVDWGHVALGVGLLMLALVLHRRFTDGGDSDDGRGGL